METQANEEYHSLLDDLAERKFFGEVTLYFQGGNIESNRLCERSSKNEVREYIKAKNRRKPLVAVSRSARNG